jgi:hypothetical protein
MGPSSTQQRTRPRKRTRLARAAYRHCADLGERLRQIWLRSTRRRQRLLLCRPQGGLNDMLCQIEKCCAYGEAHDRTTIIDTDYDQSPFFRDTFANYFDSLRERVILDRAQAPALADRLTTAPHCVQGRIEVYRFHFDQEAYGFVEDQSGEPITFDFGEDHQELLLVHNDCGGGRESVAALGRLRLKGEIADRLIERIEAMSGDYVAVQIRNTDYQSNDRDLVARLGEQILGGGCERLFVATDSARSLAFVRETWPHLQVFSFSALPERQQGSLHRYRGDESKAQIRANNIDAILDLLTLAFARVLVLIPLAANQRVEYSGFGLLAKDLRERSDVLERLVPSVVERFRPGERR